MQRSVALCLLSSLVFAGFASAELEKIQVGGTLRIMGNWYSPEAGAPLNGVFGGALGFEKGNSTSFVEQRTRLGVEAQFSNNVRTLIELDSYDLWGEDFRSDYITGVDSRAASFDDIELYQGFIEMGEVAGMPISIRIGRQEIQLGSEWLVGNNDTGSFFRGLSFDGIRATYQADTWWVTAFGTKVQENSPIEEDGDIDFYGIYGSYTGLEDIVFDAYWLYLRDGRGSSLGFPFDTPNSGLFGRINDGLESFFGVDQFSDTTQLHTLGARIAGEYGLFDFEGEFAYQRGQATNIVKTFFSPDPATSMGTPFGEDDASFTRLGANAEVGYTFDTRFQPRVFGGWAWFEGEDRREESFGDWIHTFYPFHETDASISFNRLFSDWEYSEFIDATHLSNASIIRLGIEGDATESIRVKLLATYLTADVATSTNGVFGVPFAQYESDDDLGLELGLYLDYDYSDDLRFNFGYAHLFAGDGLDNNSRFLGLFFPKPGGNFVLGNGLIRAGGVDRLGRPGDEDADYVFAETIIRF